MQLSIPPPGPQELTSGRVIDTAARYNWVVDGTDCHRKGRRATIFTGGEGSSRFIDATGERMEDNKPLLIEGIARGGFR